VVKVEDNGPGISPIDLPFVFDKFFRIGPDDHGTTKRTGLGLAICKSIIESYEGHIWVESQPEQGSTFIFTLPLASIAEPDFVPAATLKVGALPAGLTVIK
jgi:signal transduction histidine kinase